MSINRFFFKLVYDILPLISLILFSFGEVFSGTHYLILGCIFVIPFFIFYLKIYGTQRYVVIFYLTTLVGSLTNLLTTQNGIGGTILFMTTFPLALYCITHLRIVKYVALIVLVYNLLFISKKIFIDLINPEYIYEELSLSRNFPGYLLVIWTIFWSFTKYITEKRVSVILPIISFILSFFLEGRASMGILFFVAVLSLYLRNNKTIYFFPIIFTIILFYYWDGIIELFEMTRFSNQSFETSRVDIWKAYFRALDIPSLIFGLETHSVPVLSEYGGNPHNAFLNFHYRMGFAGIGALLFVMIKSFKLYLSKKEIFITILYVSIIGRFCFDSNLNVTYDFIFYSIVFFPLISQCRGDNYSNKRCSIPSTPFNWMLSLL